jgi:hypothetical protein
MMQRSASVIDWPLPGWNRRLDVRVTGCANDASWPNPEIRGRLEHRDPWLKAELPQTTRSGHLVRVTSLAASKSATAIGTRLPKASRAPPQGRRAKDSVSRGPNPLATSQGCAFVLDGQYRAPRSCSRITVVAVIQSADPFAPSSTVPCELARLRKNLCGVQTT